jgi:hypothetical protein
VEELSSLVTFHLVDRLKPALRHHLLQPDHWSGRNWIRYCGYCVMG